MHVFHNIDRISIEFATGLTHYWCVVVSGLAGDRIDKAEFVAKMHDAHAAGSPLVDGYAPFCKHVFVPNFVDARLSTLLITKENEHLLKSG